MFLDIFVEYLFRVVLRVTKIHGSSTWPVAKATVTSSDCPTSAFGCPVAEIYYTYRVNGELYTGVHEKPFILHSSGELYARQLSQGRDFAVRLRPVDPSASIVRAEDRDLKIPV